MTMTEARPLARDLREPASDQRQPTQRPTRSRTATAQQDEFVGEVLATIALALFSIGVVAGFARVFAGWDFFDNFVAIVVVGHGLGFALRRLRLPGIVAFPVLAATIVWLISFTYYRDSLTLLLPTGETLEQFQSQISLVREQFRTAVAPVNFGGGWDVLAAIGIGLTVVLSDTFAFRAFARAEALVPGGVLFVFIAALGTDRQRVALSALLVALGVVATIALRAHHAPHRPTAIGRHRSPAQLVVPAALATAAVVAIAASVVGPRIPGAESDPIYETRGGNGGSVTEVISPLVDIRSRLTNRSDSELFVVDADFESYWRSSALPRFDGTTWGLPERALSAADGELSAARDGANELRQTLRIVNLGGKFVPTAADPIAASPQDGIKWNADSATLLKTDGDLASGDTFEIVSASPRFAVADLAAAASTDAGDPIYLELPNDFPSSVGQLAREVTAGAASPFETALALQNWFRSEFDYSLEVQAGHSNNAIEGFLRDRVGYCEQFAGSYAAMMRTLGIPARVAVGFTPGVNNGDGFSVLGKNAHAWPEVWFDGLGWVPFEPTPGRGAPGAENYTNVEPQQDGSGIDPSSQNEQAPPVAPSPDVEITPQTTTPNQATPEASNDSNLNLPEEDLLAVGGGDDGSDDGFSVPWRPLGILALVGLVLIAPAALRRWRRSRRPADAATAVAVLWRRTLSAVNEVGVRTNASLTPTELALATADRFPVAARPIRSLADAVTEVSYRPDPNAVFGDARGTQRLEECGQWCRQVERAVNDSLTPAARVRRYFTQLD